MQPLDLLKAGQDLVSTGGRPRQANLRRAQSSAYYAMFHCLARCCADLMIGTTGADRSTPAWAQVYRALEHGGAKNACKNNEKMKLFPKEIEDFANKFVAMQEKRHNADYNPANRYYKSATLQDLDDVCVVIKNFRKVPVRDRRAFAAWVLFKNRP